MSQKVNDGRFCAIPWHNHTPRDCPGRARIKCEICNKALIKHETFDYCDKGDPETTIVLDELGQRRRLK